MLSQRCANFSNWPSLGQSGYILEVPDIGSAGHGGIFQQLLTGAAPVIPPLPKPGHMNPIQKAHTFKGKK